MDGDSRIAVSGDCADNPPRGCLAKRIAVAIVGGTITLVGVAMIVLPGPAFVVIPIGLSILATEFVWAKRYLRRTRELATRFKDKACARAAGLSK